MGNPIPSLMIIERRKRKSSNSQSSRSNSERSTAHSSTQSTTRTRSTIPVHLVTSRRSGISERGRDSNNSLQVYTPTNQSSDHISRWRIRLIRDRFEYSSLFSRSNYDDSYGDYLGDDGRILPTFVTAREVWREERRQNRAGEAIWQEEEQQERPINVAVTEEMPLISEMSHLHR